MNHHDVGRGRGGIGTALARVTGEVVVAGISSDRLYPLRLQHELVASIPRATGLDVVESVSGHDGFLVESEAVGKVIGRALTS
jgi:homoserine O-acetyltransferase